MINIIIADPYLNKLDEQILDQTAQAVLRSQSQEPESDLSIVIDDDARLHELNKSFLGIDAPTDVLSFSSGEEDPDPETGRLYLGDIIISYPRAVEQSEAAGHAATAEIQLLVVHGVLHLLGYDHAEPDEKEAMWKAQKEIIDRLGVKILRLPE